MDNLKAVILGDKNGVKGGSGKVVNSKPNDRIFLYYSDHGGPGVLGELVVREVCTCLYHVQIFLSQWFSFLFKDTSFFYFGLSF